MRSTLKSLFCAALTAVATCLTMTSCESVDDERIPPVGVNVQFVNIGDWHTYGVAGAGQYRIFRKTDRLPAGYPYKVSEYTGYGGLLLTCDPNGEYLVYDLSCPVEVKPDVRIAVDTENEMAGIAVCHKCGSRYNLYGYGAPISGKALDLNYGLQKYRVAVGNPSAPYAVISR